MITTDKRVTVADVVAEIRSGSTLGIGGWGSRRKPMAVVRALANSAVTDLTVVTYGGPDVGLLVAAGKVRKLVTGFVSLDSIPLEPHFRAARERGGLELAEYDEGMINAGLTAAAHRLPFLPIRAGLGSDVMTFNPELRTVRSPYPYPDPDGEGDGDGDGAYEELVAMPALRLDVAVVHANRADARGNGQFLGPDPYFDDLFCLAARRRFLTCERVVDTAELTKEGPVQTLRINRSMVDGVVETPNGAHFTSCAPDYGRDERFQKEYAKAAVDPQAWAAFHARFLSGDEADYQRAVRHFQELRP